MAGKPCVFDCISMHRCTFVFSHEHVHGICQQLQADVLQINWSDSAGLTDMQYGASHGDAAWTIT